MTPPYGPRHIAIYVPSLGGGGAERVMVMLANGFAARGHRVDLVLAKAEGPYLPDVCDNVRVVDLDKERVIASLVPLVRYLRRERPAAMLSALGHANIIAILALKISGIRMRLVVSERGSPSNEKMEVKTSIIHWLRKRLYPKSSCIVAVSKGVAEELVQEFHLPPQKVAVIHNPIDTNMISQLSKEKLEHPWLNDFNNPLILAVGRLVPEKDYPTLLKAFSLLRRERPVRLIILGDGPLHFELVAQAEQLGIAQNVEFAGFVANPYAWMSACDVYVLSSRTEGFPNSLIQALACGAPVVSTDCPHGPSEIFEEAGLGSLVPVGDFESLSKEISSALERKHVTGNLYIENFHIDIIISNYEDILTKFLD